LGTGTEETILTGSCLFAMEEEEDFKEEPRMDLNME
jgi:hypothetical protein